MFPTLRLVSVFSDLSRIKQGLRFTTKALSLSTIAALIPVSGSYANTAVGYINGELDISGGQVKYEIPLAVPPGIAGVEPSLSVRYKSFSKNGLLGTGWNISGLSAITRCGSTFDHQDGVRRPVQYNSQDNFCLGNKRLVPISGTKGADGTEYRTEYRTEADSFKKIVSYGTAGNGPAWFKVWSANGNIVEYGNTEDSRVELQGKSTVKTWAANKLTDPSGNSINYQYTEINANSEYVPNVVSYGPNESIQVRFEYDDVTDLAAQTIGGSNYKVSKRLNNVSTYVGNSKVKSWNFSFQHVAKQPSRLTSIQECDANGNCLASTDLSWSEHTQKLYSTANTFLDFNGDGIADEYYLENINSYRYWVQFVKRYVYPKSNLKIRLGTENGLGSPQTWISNIENSPQYGTQYGFNEPRQVIIGYAQPAVTVGDFNGDGKTDVRLAYKNYRSTGSGLSYTGSNNTYSYASADVNGDGRDDFILSGGAVKLSSESGNFSSASYSGSGLSGCTYYDINADGKDDAQCNNGLFIGSKTGWGYSPNRTDLANKTNKVALLSGISAGKSHSFNYAHISDANTHQRSANTPEVRNQLFLVNRSETSDGAGGQVVTTYTYGDAKQADTGRGFLGFAWIQADNETYNTRVRNEYRQDFPFIGRTSDMTSTLISDGTLLSQSVYEYTDQTGDNGKTHFAYLSKNTRKKYELDGSLVRTTITDNTNLDSYGNAGKVTVTTTGGNETYTKTVDTTYQNDINNWFIGQPLTSAETLTHSNGSTQSRNFGYSYDSTTGLLTELIAEPDSAASITTQYLYDSVGNKIQESVQPANETARATRYEYDANQQFHIKTINALEQQETYTVEPAFGNLLSQTGPNGLTSYYEYDGFGDLVKETLPDGTATNIQYNWADSCSVQLASAAYCQLSKKDGESSVEEFFDIYGRIIRTATVGFNGRKIFTDNQYNSRGELVRTSRPYYSGDDAVWATFTYDDTGRTLTETAPGADGGTKSTQFAYNGLTTTVTNARNQDKVTQTNALGQIISVQDPENASVTYTYDARGNLILTRDDQGNEISITYDLYDRKVGMNDPDLGIWQYSYNGFGDLISQTDAKGQTSTMTYDVLGRMISRTEAEGTSTWEYDTAANGIGKLANVTGTNGYQKTYSYDSLSRLLGSTTEADARSMTLSAEYDEYSRVKRLIRPQGFITENVYNDSGYLQAVRTPKSWVTDYEAGHVFEELAKLIAQGMSQAQALALEAANLRAKAQQYTDQANALYDNHGTAQQLRAAADKLNAEAAVLEAKAGKYLAWVSALSAHPTYGPVIRQSLVTQRQAWEASPSHRMWAENYADSVISQTFARFIPIINGSIIIFVPKVDVTDGVPATDKINYIRFYGEELRQQAATKRASAAEKLAKIASRSNDNLSPEDQQAVNEANSLVQQAELALAEAVRVDARINELDKAAQSDTDAQNDDAYVYFWRAKERDASGRLINEFFGNGLTSTYTYNTSNGLMSSQRTGLLNVQDIRHLTYQYDNLNNITQRADLVNRAQESFTYDGLDRLKTSQVTSQLQGNAYTKTVNYAYDTLGNITHKSGVGDYSYGTGIANGGAGPHAVTRAGDNTYQYDANGNMVSGAGRTIAWSSFNKPVQITKDGNTENFTYAPDRSRYLRTDNHGSKTLYLDQLYELTTKGQAVTHRQFIYAGDQLVAQQETGLDAQGQSKPVQTRYMHRDNLGSVDTVTDGVGNVVERMSFDPFGERRPSNWREATPGISLIPVLTNRGFTGHETLDSVGLIHMNGRVYDATLGRFLSADPFIQDPLDTQSFNRYSYVLNNPLRYTDPSGFNWHDTVGQSYSKAQRSSPPGESINDFAYDPAKHGKTKDLKAVPTDVVETDSPDSLADKNTATSNIEMHYAAMPDPRRVVAVAFLAMLNKIKALLSKPPSKTKNEPPSPKVGDPVKDKDTLTVEDKDLKVEKSVKDQALELKTLNNNKNTVTVQSENKKTHFDLDGNTHKGVETPHKQYSYPNKTPTGETFFNKDRKTVDPMTQQDIRTVRNILERRNSQ